MRELPLEWLIDCIANHKRSLVNLLRVGDTITALNLQIVGFGEKSAREKSARNKLLLIHYTCCARDASIRWDSLRKKILSGKAGKCPRCKKADQLARSRLKTAKPEDRGWDKTRIECAQADLALALFDAARLLSGRTEDVYSPSHFEVDP